MEIVEVCIIEDPSIRLTGSEEEPFGLTEQGEASDTRRAEAGTEEAETFALSLSFLKPGNRITEITVGTVTGRMERIKTHGLIFHHLEIGLLPNRRKSQEEIVKYGIVHVVWLHNRNNRNI